MTSDFCIHADRHRPNNSAEFCDYGTAPFYLVIFESDYLHIFLFICCLVKSAVTRHDLGLLGLGLRLAARHIECRLDAALILGLRHLRAYHLARWSGVNSILSDTNSYDIVMHTGPRLHLALQIPNQLVLLHSLGHHDIISLLKVT